MGCCKDPRMSARLSRIAKRKATRVAKMNAQKGVTPKRAKPAKVKPTKVKGCRNCAKPT